MCPGSAACIAGQCGPPGTSGSGGGGGSSGGGSGGTIIAGTSNGGGPGGTSAASGGGGGDDEGELGSTPTGDPGCACHAVGSRDGSGMMTLLAAALAGALGIRRRRQRA
jgi:MYXO-CTERM domain-containing protein